MAKCDFGLLVALRFYEPNCGGGTQSISGLPDQKSQQVFHLLTPHKCEDKSRLAHLNICSNHLDFSSEFFKTLKKRTKCKFENCDNRKDRHITAAQSWSIFSKKKTYVPPGSPVCPKHRQEINRWASEKEQSESSNVELEALNVDIFPEECQEEKEVAKADIEEDEGPGEPNLKKRKAFYESSVR